MQLRLLFASLQTATQGGGGRASNLIFVPQYAIDFGLHFKQYTL
jgi:hypothetical protein